MTTQNELPTLTPRIYTGTLTEVHRTPDGRETCTGGLRLDMPTMTATCPQCGRVFGVIVNETKETR